MNSRMSWRTPVTERDCCNADQDRDKDGDDGIACVDGHVLCDTDADDHGGADNCDAGKDAVKGNEDASPAS